MVDQRAQELVDVLRAAGVARLIATFEKEAEVVHVEQIELYETNENAAGGYSFDPVTPEDATAIKNASVALLLARYDGKRAAGKLLVDEEDRIWGEGVHEADLEPDPPAAGLRVEL